MSPRFRVIGFALRHGWSRCHISGGPHSEVQPDIRGEDVIEADEAVCTIRSLWASGGIGY